MIIAGCLHLLMKPNLNKISLIATVILLCGAGLFFMNRQNAVHQQIQRDEFARRGITIDIGPYPNLKAEQRASVQKLSLELHQHHQAKWVQINAGKSAWRHGVMGYLRVGRSKQGNHAFWYDNRFSSPDFGKISTGEIQGISVFRIVSEEDIHAIARKQGLPDDIFNYDMHLRKQLGISIDQPF